MKRYKLTFEYEGTRFNGWQKQPKGRTVQGIIEEAFSSLYQQEISIAGQGRTDSGVHAERQVAHADLPPTFSTDRLQRAMLRLLPKDIALVGAEKADEEFHARFDAIARIYRYQLVTRPSPLKRKFSWPYFQPISFKYLQKCAKMITGEHDFVNFCIPPENDEPNTRCIIHQSRWERKDDLLIYTIEGNRFLRHMVRRLVGTMVRVGEGKIDDDDFEQLLNADQTERKGHSAPANGLTLVRVKYE